MAANERMKTRLCKHFEKGYCRRGNTCNFAHGSKELRPRMSDDGFVVVPFNTHSTEVSLPSLQPSSCQLPSERQAYLAQ